MDGVILGEITPGEMQTSSGGVGVGIGSRDYPHMDRKKIIGTAPGDPGKW